MTNVSFLGLGAMGLPMASRILAAGFPLTVWNRTPGRDGDLLARGAIRAATPAEAARRGDVVATMLATPEAVEAVAAGPDGLLEGLSAGSVWLDFSTVSPSDSRKWASLARARGASFCDVPVAGSVVPAREGTLTVLAGGEPAALARASGLLGAVSRHVERVGPVGSGSALKLVNNLLYTTSLAGFAEALALAQRLGLEVERTAGWLLATPAASPYLRAKSEFLAAGGRPAHFALRLAEKDVRLAVEASGGSVLLAEAVRSAYHAAAEAGFGDEDFSHVITHQLRASSRKVS
jgi:3-hydroxyisobutyrate dehydrogenase-like beta-hydroxyacid dehydrogenase